MEIMETIRQQVADAIRYVCEMGKLRAGDLVVLGCSTSEVLGGRIGKSGSPELGREIVLGALSGAEASSASVAFQCCEHLNRALVVPRGIALARGYEIVRAVPHPHAGGSMAAAAWRELSDPVLVERIQAEAGADIGDTLIGMHLRPVAVPLRYERLKIGEARLVMATTRPRYIGGERARYDV